MQIKWEGISLGGVFVTTGGWHWPSPRHRAPVMAVGRSLHKAQYVLWEGLDVNKKGRRGEGESGDAVGQFCVVMTTSCAIRTHSVTITTQGSCRVSAKQPTWGNLQKQANQSERRDWWRSQTTTLERERTPNHLKQEVEDMRQHSMPSIHSYTHRLDTDTHTHPNKVKLTILRFYFISM